MPGRTAPDECRLNPSRSGSMWIRCEKICWNCFFPLIMPDKKRVANIHDMKKNPFHYLILLVVCLAAYFQWLFCWKASGGTTSIPICHAFISSANASAIPIFPLWLHTRAWDAPYCGDLISTNYPEAFFTRPSDRL